MSDADGTVVIKASEEITQKLARCRKLVDSGSVFELLEFSGLSAYLCEGLSEDTYYSISEATNTSGYVAFSVDTNEWTLLVRALIKQAKNIEVYANITSEHGTCTLYALNAGSQRFQYWYDIDGGDETCQDDFDEDKYLEELKKNQMEWLSLIPKQVKKDFSALEELADVMI